MSFRDGVDTTYRNKFRARGGQGDFSWDQLKGDKSAAAQEYYLGRSQMCEDIWYNRGAAGSRKRPSTAELDEARRQDDEMMRQAMGLAPLKKKRTEMTSKEQEEALRRTADTEDAQGLGMNLQATKASTMYREATGASLEGLETGVVAGDVEEAEDVQGGETTEGHIPREVLRPDASVLAMRQMLSKKELRKAEKKAKKRAKKEQKKEKKKRKKEAKRRKKDRKRRRGSSSDTSSSSSDSSDSS
eukprot:TRINITY_DN25774_c0_g1_i1.p1 TRINITY_DN25774_c0_g1~~TRINITY_DN25774_c0_g1_i1.p1  ORF type:complete len:244 (+),score=99.27 TRINITY_DN25774_c0_g1_i1:103-834(+)